MSTPTVIPTTLVSFSQYSNDPTTSFDAGSDVSAVTDCSIDRPTEVSPPGSATPLRFTDKTTLTWQPAAPNGSNTFNLRRDPLAYLALGGTGSCLQTAIATHTATDVAVPSPGGGLFYLVQGRNPAGDGSLGSASNGTLRPIKSSCP